MDKEDIEALANELVNSHIANGAEYISIVEATRDEYEDATDEEIEMVAVKVRQKLAHIGMARQKGLI